MLNNSDVLIGLIVVFLTLLVIFCLLIILIVKINKVLSARKVDFLFYRNKGDANHDGNKNCVFRAFDRFDKFDI